MCIPDISACTPFLTYARHVVIQPANLHERILTYLPEPGDSYHFWRVSEGVTGSPMEAFDLRDRYMEGRIF